MRNWIGCLIVFVFLWCGTGLNCPATPSGQEAGQVPELLPDTFFEKYHQDADFNYEEEVGWEEYSLFRKLWKFLRKYLSLTREAYQTLHILWRIGIIAFVITMLVLAVMKTRMYQIFYTQHPLPGTGTALYENDPMPEDLSTAIDREEQNGAYRAAIRLQFLKVLSGLFDRKLIGYAREKTNYDYAYEIQNVLVRKGFIDLTQCYNYIWYGQHEIDQKEYLLLRNQFETFHTCINGQSE